jgi:hypothetical protein
MHAAPSPAARIRSGSPLVVRHLLTGRRAVAQMADDFQTLVVGKGSVENEDLLVIGWTQALINQHAATARLRALEASVR